MGVMGYVPEKDRTTAWYLFNKRFQVRINPNKVRSVEDIKRFGTPSTGNEDVDREMDKAEHIVMWNIAELENHFANGYPVKFVKRSDCDQVYEYIQKHLAHMRAFLDESENVTNNPDTMAELVRLDNFADAVFQYARYGLQDNLQHAAYARRAIAKNPFARMAENNRQRTSAVKEEALPGNSSVGRQYGTASDQPAVPIDPNAPMELDPIIEDPNLPKRVSLANLFEARRQMGSRWK